MYQSLDSKCNVLIEPKHRKRSSKERQAQGDFAAKDRNLRCSLRTNAQSQRQKTSEHIAKRVSPSKQIKKTQSIAQKSFPLSWLPVYLVVLILTGSYFQLSHLAYILVASVGLDLGYPVIYRQKLKSRQMQLCDWAVLSIVLLELLSFFVSTYQANSFAPLLRIALGALFYFLIRLSIRETKQIVVVAAAIGLLGAYLSWHGLLQFDSRFKEFRAVGFTDIVALRATLIAPPVPYVLGEWLTIVLLTLPFSFGVTVYSWLTGRRLLALLGGMFTMLVTGILFASCSRAVFASVLAFFGFSMIMTTIYRMVTWKQAALGFALIAAFLLCLLAIENRLYPGMAAAYYGGSASQARSAEGRLSIWERSLTVFKVHPVLGVGAGNLPLFLSSTSKETDTTGFASRAFSLPVQILAENGLLGLSSYAFLLICVLFRFHRNMKIVERRIPDRILYASLAAGLLAALIRDLTYSSLLEHTVTVLLISTTFGLLVNGENTCET